MYYPSGWKMKNNANIYEVNNIIRGIEIEPGDNLHTMVFEPLDYKYGKIIIIHNDRPWAGSGPRVLYPWVFTLYLRSTVAINS